MKVKHKLVALMATGAVVAAALVTSAGTASAQGFSFPVIGGAASVSTAFFGHTPPPVTHVGWEVVPAQGNITSSNNAVAFTTNCTGCVAEAVSFQIILDSNRTDYSSFDTLTDNATSINTNCTSCTALSVAYQWVLMSTGPVSLTPQGQSELATAHAQLQAVLATYPPGPVFETALHNVVTTVGQILQNEGTNIAAPIFTPNNNEVSTPGAYQTLVRVAEEPSPCAPSDAAHCYWFHGAAYTAAQFWPLWYASIGLPGFCDTPAGQATGNCPTS
jgi:hypothetical protein